MKKLLTTALLLAAACTAPAADIPAVDQAAELESLRAAAEAYHAAASSKDAEAVVAMYHTDPLMIPPSAELVEGTEAVEGYRFGFISTPGVELEFEIVRAEVSKAGDMGWTLAIGNITINREGQEPDQDVVRDFHVWHKQPDGSWKVAVDVWNSGMPAG